MHRFPIPRLGADYIFPDPRLAMDEGLLAYGGDLNPNRVLKAYQHGIFPWFNPQDPILWWSPNPRAIMLPQEFKVSKSFSRVLRNKNYTIQFDNNFEKVISLCAKIPRKDEGESWIVEAMRQSYTLIHQKGYAHSVEVYMDQKLVGGLYGVSLGAAFFGESMFSLVKDGSKIAFFYLNEFCKHNGFDYIDCQMPTPHLQSLGAKEIEREHFLDMLKLSNKKQTLSGSWADLAKDIL